MRRSEFQSEKTSIIILSGPVMHGSNLARVEPISKCFYNVFHVIETNIFRQYDRSRLPNIVFHER